jgi:hypothetical protein
MLDCRGCRSLEERAAENDSKGSRLTKDATAAVPDQAVSVRIRSLPREQHSSTQSTTICAKADAN